MDRALEPAELFMLAGEENVIERLALIRFPCLQQYCQFLYCRPHLYSEVKVECGKVIWGSIKLSGLQRKERREILSKGP